MTPKKISQIIEKEINGDWSASNMHGCDLRKCLIRPKKRMLQFSEKLREAWIVLEEDPINLNGYKVFYDEESERFGLAGNAEPYGYACNFHETFLAAFESM